MDVVKLSGGVEVLIRPIEPDDGPRLAAAYSHLSEESRYRRFLAAKPFLSAAEVRYLVGVDGISHVALVAVMRERPNRIVAVARFVRLPEEEGVAEIAVVVGDPYQRQGLGRALLERLGVLARERGILGLRATMLADNEAAHGLVRRLAVAQARRQQGAVHEFRLALPA